MDKYERLPDKTSGNLSYLFQTEDIWQLHNWLFWLKYNLKYRGFE